MKIDVHGSCVSYSIIKDQFDGKSIRVFEDIENNYYFSHVNIAGTMTGKIRLLPKEEDFQIITNHIRRNIISDLKKEVLDILMKSEAEWLMVDFYDFARIQWAYENGSYTHVADLQIAAPEYWDKIKNEIQGTFRWIDLPTYLWYGNIDRYFEHVIKKYGKEHIILNRVNLSQYFLDEEKNIREFSSDKDYLGSYKDGEKIRRLEDYVIQKYGIHNIDVAKFFMADWECGKDYLNVHYEPQYYKLAGKIVKNICSGGAGFATDMLDTESVIYKLQKNEEVCIKNHGFKYLTCAESPFTCFKPLDDLLKVLDMEEILESTEIIALLYQFVEENVGFFYDDTISEEEKQVELVKIFEKLANERELHI